MCEASTTGAHHRTGLSFSPCVLPARAAPTASSAALLQSLDTNTDSDGGIVLGSSISEDSDYVGDDIEKWVKSSHKRPSPQNSEIRRSPRPRGFDWCGRGFHVDFQTYEEIPLQRGRFLGPGVSGGVYETVCKGMRLAWKTNYCSRGIRPEQRKEIDILKGLSHHHIVSLMGTYTQGLFFGLLLAPVAVCNLLTFMTDIDELQERLANGESCTIDDTQMMRRLDELCPDTGGGSNLHYTAVSRLSSCFGCLVGVINYVHAERIRHKDVKPSNILLSNRGMWLADFGISSDFSALSSSQSEAVDRGTLQYFAPEVASYEKSGRAADIFSLGCIFLEMVALLESVPLCEFKKLRPEQNGSFQANLKHKASWFVLLKSHNLQLQHLLCEIESMIDTEARSRPLAFQLDRHLSIIAQFGGNHSRPLHGPCCARERFIDQLETMTAEIQDLQLAVMQRDEYIDELIEARPPSKPQSSFQVPRPPLGPNLSAMVRANVAFHSSRKR